VEQLMEEQKKKDKERVWSKCQPTSNSSFLPSPSFSHLFRLVFHFPQFVLYPITTLLDIPMGQSNHAIGDHQPPPQEEEEEEEEDKTHIVFLKEMMVV